MKHWRFVLCVSVVMCVATMPPRTGIAASCLEGLSELFQRVSPAVVSISSLVIDPLKYTERIDVVTGSGFIISADGLLLTNAHVVFHHHAITVTLDDGRTTSAKLLGADAILDLAVLRLLPPAKAPAFPTLSLGNSDAIRVGEDVMAIGNPLGLDQTLTHGVISGVDQLLAEPPVGLPVTLLQTDADINPGNSGGPLLNRCGEVIGITTAAITEAENIGFVVPINTVKRVLPQLIEQGRVIRPWFGAIGKIIEKELRDILNLPLASGFLVEAVEPGSPAEKAGLHGGSLLIAIAGEEFLFGGDIITMINGQPTGEADKFLQLIQSLHVGDTVRLTLSRDGKTRHVEWRLPERPLLPGDLPSAGHRRLQPSRQLPRRGPRWR
jgi:S1-C subfamily serine protease